MPKAASDPQRNAIALAYSQTDAAPRVVAKGRGLMAEQIIARAHEHGIYVHESAEMVSLLMQVDLDQHIPPQLYLAVAELLAWLYRLENGESGLPVPAFAAAEQ
ncbi:putative flagellar biosynthetic protein [Candidatus Accumulibacter aalborgensis]|uniref:Putative flagellar biosynthetic protein n=1 Tax=Candidatus Accumulibacter aalborgensis TaxID=1860102 RepID=A0A1A8XUR3_9PROT|nr:EscU/YscU/HrcU family type III secretion system export apparatus switch protein [Candidatus Accumulibacter aalborgensis]SBT07683.1 putative flagellar biosynthetic protein [Candidatus Accumulibacter aalborgensis]